MRLHKGVFNACEFAGYTRGLGTSILPNYLWFQ